MNDQTYFLFLTRHGSSLCRSAAQQSFLQVLEDSMAAAQKKNFHKMTFFIRIKIEVTEYVSNSHLNET